jgi:hypothetical protein
MDLLELEPAMIDVNSHERWMVEQLLLTSIADSVPQATWTEGLAAA